MRTASSVPLHVKYRPAKLAQVVGHGAVIGSLREIVKKKRSKSFLFSGPSGVGKTTLARIAARGFGCSGKSVMEVDAATHTGVDAMRAIQDVLQYKPLGQSQMRAVIVDEAHMLSRSAWNSLLKIVEEPPEHVVWFFCTTEPGKVPQTIKTRCTSFTLNLVEDESLAELINSVVEQESMEVPEDVLDLVVKEARGSPRQALVNLALCESVRSKKDAAQILRTALESDATIELCRFLVSGGSWAKAMVIVNKLQDQNAESIRIVVCNYMASVLKGAKGDKQACQALHVLESFSGEYNPSEKQAPLLLSIGRVLYQAE